MFCCFCSIITFPQSVKYHKSELNMQEKMYAHNKLFIIYVMLPRWTFNYHLLLKNENSTNTYTSWFYSTKSCIAVWSVMIILCYMIWAHCRRLNKIDMTYLSIIVIVSFLLLPWNGKLPVNISNCKQTISIENDVCSTLWWSHRPVSDQWCLSIPAFQFNCN